MSKKYFWLKLKKDFFKRHDIKILEAMPDGHLSVLFYLKLMLESIDHEGALRFSDEVPYSPEMLSVITDTDIEVVNSSLKRLQDLKLLEITQDGTILIDKVKSMTGFETEWAKKKKEYREKKGQKADKEKTREGQSEDNVLTMSSKCPHNVLAKEDNVRQEIELEIEKEIEIDSKEKSIKEKPAKRFIPPTVEEVRAYCQERDNGVDPEKFVAHYTSNGWKVGKNPMRNWRAAVITWERKDKAEGNTAYQYRKPEGNIGMFSHLRDKE